MKCSSVTTDKENYSLKLMIMEDAALEDDVPINLIKDAMGSISNEIFII